TGTGGSKGGTSGKGGTGGMAGGGEGGEGTVIIPPEPGKPGTVLSPAGSWRSSASYKLFSVMSEGPLPVNGTSQHYRLHGSVIGTTQPEDVTP
ncbi:MAG TPA: hypothetical protein VNN72_28000, partial [Polyangiaceae bacterium]|nr:hypothetical protein [Polyangiaceae bacterium]